MPRDPTAIEQLNTHVTNEPGDLNDPGDLNYDGCGSITHRRRL